MSESKQEEFFIGWQSEAPTGIGKFLKGRTVVLLIVALIIALGSAALQKTISGSRIEFGNIRSFSGVIITEPIPMLLTSSPEESSGQSVFILTDPFKNGFDAAVAAENRGKQVELQGTLLYDEDTAMIEVVRGSVEAGPPASDPEFPAGVSLGTQSLKGEIVDSKCWLGMMNPGSLKPHRACAINCIAGGVPPLFLLRGDDGKTTKLILTGPGGKAINQEVLEFVAEAIQVEGEVIQCGSLLFLEADPAGFKRL